MCSNCCGKNIVQLISQRGNSYLCYCNCDKYELHMKIASFAGQETKYRYSLVMKKGFGKLCSGKWTICIYKNQKPEWLGWKILNKPGTLEASCSTFFNNSREIHSRGHRYYNVKINLLLQCGIWAWMERYSGLVEAQELVIFYSFAVTIVNCLSGLSKFSKTSHKKLT